MRINHNLQHAAMLLAALFISTGLYARDITVIINPPASLSLREPACSTGNTMIPWGVSG